MPLTDSIYYNHNDKTSQSYTLGLLSLGLLSLRFCHQNAGEFLQVLPHLKYV